MLVQPSSFDLVFARLKVMDNKIGSPETESALSRLLARRSVRIATIWVGWTLVGLFFTSQILVSYSYMDKPIPFDEALFWQTSVCYLWALATPLVLWLARRFRIERQYWARRLAVHAVVGLFLAASISALHYPIFQPYLKLFHMSIPGRCGTSSFNLDRQLCIYWLLVLMSHALNYYNSFRQGQLQAAQLRTQLVQANWKTLRCSFTRISSLTRCTLFRALE